MTAWVAVEKEGYERFGYCTCMAGFAEVHSHSLALHALMGPVAGLD